MVLRAALLHWKLSVFGNYRIYESGEYMKTKDKILNLIFLVGILIIIISSCVAMGNYPKFSLSVEYKNSNANYGDNSVYYKDKVYFVKGSNLYSLDISNDKVSYLFQKKFNGELCSIDSNIAYFAEYNINYIKLYSIDLNGKNLKTVVKFVKTSRPIGDGGYCVINGVIYRFSNGIGVVNNNNSSEITVPKNAQSIKSPDGTFSLIISNNYIYIKRDGEPISGLLNTNTNISMPYIRGQSILSYDNTNGKVYVEINDTIYYVQNGAFTLLTKFNRNDLNEGDTFVFTEDDKDLYLALGNTKDEDELFQINKVTGAYKNVYKTVPNEKILTITSQYFVTYKKGYIYKYNLSDSRLIKKMMLFDGKEGIFSYLQLHCTGNYLFSNKDNKLSVINLNKMDTIKIS